MNCPSCGNKIGYLTRSCPNCGYDYGEALYDKFAFYFGLKNELDKLKTLQNSLYAGIANVSVRIKTYEEVLRRDLSSLPVRVKKAGRKKRKKK